MTLEASSSLGVTHLPVAKCKSQLNPGTNSKVIILHLFHSSLKRQSYRLRLVKYNFNNIAQLQNVEPLENVRMKSVLRKQEATVAEDSWQEIVYIGTCLPGLDLSGQLLL